MAKDKVVPSKYLFYVATIAEIQKDWYASIEQSVH